MIEPIVEAHGLELVDAELVRGRGPWELRVTVDTPLGDGKEVSIPFAEIGKANRVYEFTRADFARPRD